MNWSQCLYWYWKERGGTYFGQEREGDEAVLLLEDAGGPLLISTKVTSSGRYGTQRDVSVGIRVELERPYTLRIRPRSMVREGVNTLLEGLDLRMDYGPDGAQRMYLEGEDISQAIRASEVSGWASKVSAIPEVRAFLLDFQRRQAREHNVVMDGRDIGTVVLPQADVKIFLTAAPEDRARRRYEELRQRGQEADYASVLRDILQRDEQDTSRAAAPLRQAEDALLVDTTGNSLEKSLGVLLDTIKERLRA